MNKINEISIWLQYITISGVALRVIYCFIRISGTEDEAARYKKRIIHSIIFLIISQLVFALKDLIIGYYR